MNIEVILNEISIWVVILPLLVGIFFFRSLSYSSMIVFGIVASATIPQLLREFVNDKETISIAYNLYTPAEFFLTFLLFKDKFKKQLNKNILKSLMALFIVASVVLCYYYNIKTRFINEWVCFANFVYTALILLLILEQYGQKENNSINDTFFLWYLVALFFYAPCTLLIFSLWQYLKSNQNSFLNNLWVIHHFFNIMMYVFFSVGFYIDSRKKIII